LSSVPADTGNQRRELIVASSLALKRRFDVSGFRHEFVACDFESFGEPVEGPALPAEIWRTARRSGPPPSGIS
jgi:hypothetical protein